MQSSKKYKGIIIPTVTPVTQDFQLDEGSLETMFANFYQHRVSPFILGTTGESASFSNPFKLQYIKAAGKLKQPDTFLYAGISSNCLDESIELSKYCLDAGVDVLAATLPTYYTLTESQMKQYFEQLAAKVSLPLVIYNIPATTHMSIPLHLIDELSHHENIVGTKDSERSDERLQTSISLWAKREDFSHFLGWAGRSARALIDGSDGLIPSTGNLYPKLYSDMLAAVSASDTDKAFQLQTLSDDLGNLYQSGKTLGESLWALKVLMEEYGLCKSYAMPPLQSLPDSEKEKLLISLHEILNKENIQL